MTIPNHPDYVSDSVNWEKYRLAYEGGRDFVEKYLKQYTTREDMADFLLRKSITYCPAHAKAAIMEIKNSIFERMSDVIRVGGPESYQEAISGVDGGVDFTGRNMTSFIGTEVLPEFLVMRRVGVFVDKEPVKELRTKADDKDKRPYLYAYKAEDILSWAHDNRNRLISVLLRSRETTIDPLTGLASGEEEKLRLLRLVNGVVTHSIMDKDGQLGAHTILKLEQIPFVMFEMTESLMCDIADYQIALLNLESSDIAYLLKSNFPFYTEQTNGLSDIGNLARQGQVALDSEGKPVVTVTDNSQTVSVGSATGRRYPKGTERPGFIHPSPEPMDVSMRKQTDMKSAIRQLVQLALSNLAPQRASGESKQMDQQGLEAGLAYIGLVLETGENKIAKIWAEYEGSQTALVAYPDQYSLLSDAERLALAKELATQLPKVPSLTAQKALAKKIAFLIIGRGITLKQEQDIIREIDAAEIIAIDPETLLLDVEAGLVGLELASAARLYPKGQVAIAKKEHIARLAAIAIAQAPGGGAGSNAARGVATDPQDKSGVEEKDDSQKADKQPAGSGKAVRGEGKPGE